MEVRIKHGGGLRLGDSNMLVHYTKTLYHYIFRISIFLIYINKAIIHFFPYVDNSFTNSIFNHLSELPLYN